MLRRVVVLQAFRWPSVPLQVPRCSFSSADVSSPPSAAPAAASLSLQDLQRQRSPLYKPVRGQTPLLPHLPLTAAVRCRCRPTISYCTAGYMALCGLLAAHWQDPLTKFERRWYWLLKTMAVYSKKGLILRNSEALFRSLEEQATQDSFYTCTVWQRRSCCGGDWREGVGAP